MWLAQVGSERIEEIIDSELTIERVLETYAKKGYSTDWINQRLQTIRASKELTVPMRNKFIDWKSSDKVK